MSGRALAKGHCRVRFSAPWQIRRRFFKCSRLAPEMSALIAAGFRKLGPIPINLKRV
jgi:hypothetical protein